MEEDIVFIVKSLHHYAFLKSLLVTENLSIPVFYDPDVEACFNIAAREKAHGTRAIITTGYLYEQFAAKFSLPIVPIHRDAFSFAVCILDALKKYDRVAILTADSPTSTYTKAAIEAQSAFSDKVRLYQFPWPHDIGQSLKTIQNEHYYCAIAPSWATDLLRQENIEPFFVSLSERNVLEAIKQARFLRNIYNERAKNEALITTVLNATDDGLIAINQDGFIMYINQSALEILDAKESTTLNHHYSETALKSLNLNSMLLSCKPICGIVAPILNTMVMCNFIPAIIQDGNSVFIITCKLVEKIQEAECKIRSKLLKHGNIAHHTFESIIGNSDHIQETINVAKQYAKVDSTILISAPSGCGKEVFAQSIHNSSHRNSKPFVVINCAALPESVLESELFGYAPGAFTGARHEGKAGLFELAHGGTVFMDEVSEMPLSMQARFLRVLQEKEVMRIGGDRAISIDIRFIAATNRNLQSMVTNGTFREDLFYRLGVLLLQIPPLSERKSDIPSLAHYFLANRSKELNMQMPLITSQALEILQSLDYPGNVRQLNNLLERAMVLSSSGEINISTLELCLGNTKLQSHSKEDCSLKAAKVNSELEQIQKVLQDCNGNRTQTAQQLGISTATLWRKMKRLGLI